MIRINTIERYGYAANGTVAPVKIYFDDEKILFKYNQVIDVFLILLSMIPVVGYIIEIINNLRRLFKKIKKYFKKLDNSINEDKEGFEFLRIDYNQITELKINEKTFFHSWLLYHLTFFPLVDLFIFSLGSSKVTIIYIVDGKRKKKKVIFPTIYSQNKFKEKLLRNYKIQKIKHNKPKIWEDIIIIPLNISFSLLILYMFLLDIWLLWNDTDIYSGNNNFIIN